MVDLGYRGTLEIRQKLNKLSMKDLKIPSRAQLNAKSIFENPEFLSSFVFPDSSLNPSSIFSEIVKISCLNLDQTK